MKNIFVIFCVSAFLLLVTNVSLVAQTFCKTDPSSAHILVDTTQITAMEVTFYPGKATNVHTHPAHYAYAFDSGKLQINFADGKSETVEFKAGDSFYSAPERPHSTINLGTKPVRMLLVELNEHPYMAMKK